MSKNLKTIRSLFLIVIVAEAILAVPFAGLIIILKFFYFPLLITLLLHIVVLKEIQKTPISSALPITGIVLTLFAWIPFFGWMSHIGLVIAYAVVYFDSNKTIPSTQLVKTKTKAVTKKTTRKK